MIRLLWQPKFQRRTSRLTACKPCCSTLTKFTPLASPSKVRRTLVVPSAAISRLVFTCLPVTSITASRRAPSTGLEKRSSTVSLAGFGNSSTSGIAVVCDSAHCPTCVVPQNCQCISGEKGAACGYNFANSLFLNGVIRWVIVLCYYMDKIGR